MGDSEIEIRGNAPGADFRAEQALEVLARLVEQLLEDRYRLVHLSDRVAVARLVALHTQQQCVNKRNRCSLFIAECEPRSSEGRERERRIRGAHLRRFPQCGVEVLVLLAESVHALVELRTRLMQPALALLSRLALILRGECELRVEKLAIAQQKPKL